jgi:hypothetical protein
MAQTKYSANLSAADFTFSFSFKGPSVVIPGADQSYYQSFAGWAGETPQRGTNIPQLMYCENTVPTAEGYRSVAYKWFVEPPTPPQRFVRYIPMFEGTGKSVLLGITADLKIYALSALTSGQWQLVTWDDSEFGPAPAAWTTPAQITYATAAGFSLIHIAGVGTWAFNYLAQSLVYLPLDGLDDTKLNGICASSGYLIAWDDTTIYWSSTEHILDFNPSLITGAGSANVDGLKGTIKLCKEIGGGFIIYSDVSIVSAAYSSNSAIPFIFDVLAGGAGVRDDMAVAHDINTQIHFAWTTAGLMGIELHQCKAMFPQLTDFIASGISDSSTVDGHPVINWLDEYKEVRIAIISSRYLCVSFGQEYPALPNEYPTHDLSQALLYDLQFKRWGKLNIEHVQIIEAPFVAKEQVFF